jgi:acetoin utilization protein AcuB
MFVRERMTSPAVTITPDTRLQAALTLLHQRQFRRLPVVDAQGTLVGIVSERDLLYASPPPATLLRGRELSDLVAGLRVEEIMTREVITTTPGAFIEEAARLMVEHKIGGLPVVDGEGRVVGVITETDLFRALIDLYRADHAGLYLALKVPPTQGALAALSKAVLGLGDDVVGISMSHDEATGRHRLVIKGRDLDQERVVSTLEALGVHVLEARAV